MSQEMIPYQEIEKMAVSVTKSGLFGVKTVEQAISMMLLAQSLGVHPMQAVMEYNIIQGRPSKKAEAMLASFIQAGGSVQWHKLDDMVADATFSHPQGGTIRLSWDIARAKMAGLFDRPESNYKKYPRAMLRSRVISEGVRTIYPAATGGLRSPEEFEEEITAGDLAKLDPKKSRLENIIDVQSAPTAPASEPPAPEPTPEPTPEPPPPADPTGNKITEGIVEECKLKTGETAGKKWTKYGVKIKSEWYNTFSETIYKNCLEFKKNGALCYIEYIEGQYGREFVDIRIKTLNEVKIPI